MEEKVGLSFKKKIALVIFGIVFAFFASVAIDHLVYGYFQKTGFFKYLLPNSAIIYTTDEFYSRVTTSSQGLRNQEVTIPKPQNVYRILVLGDSFTYGWGVANTEAWPKVLEKELSISGKKVEVVNAGVPGVGISEETTICQDYASWMDADAVIVGLNVPDDLTQSYVNTFQANKLKAFINGLWPTLNNLREVSYRLKAQDNGHRVVFVSNEWINTALGYRNKNNFEPADPTVRQAFFTGKINPSFVTLAHEAPLYFTSMLDPQYLGTTADTLVSDIAKLKSNCVGGRPLILVALPSYDLVSQAYYPYREKVGFKEDPALLTLPIDDVLSSRLQPLQVTYLSVISAFRKDGCPGCYFPWDSHPTPLGQKRIADTIAMPIAETLKQK